MKKASFIVSYFYHALVCIIIAGCASAKTSDTSGDIVPASSLLPYGRTALANDQLELISSASHFAFSFEGKECQLFASLSDWQDHNYLQFELDGKYQKRLRINKGQNTLTLNAISEGKHAVTIIRPLRHILARYSFKKSLAKTFIPSNRLLHH